MNPPTDSSDSTLSSLCHVYTPLINNTSLAVRPHQKNMSESIRAMHYRTAMLNVPRRRGGGMDLAATNLVRDCHTHVEGPLQLCFASARRAGLFVDSTANLLQARGLEGWRWG